MGNSKRQPEFVFRILRANDVDGHRAYDLGGVDFFFINAPTTPHFFICPSSLRALSLRAGPPTPGSSIALDLNPVFYLRVARLAQHLAPHLRLDVAFPLLIGHTKHLRPKRAAFGADVWI